MVLRTEWKQIHSSITLIATTAAFAAPALARISYNWCGAVDSAHPSNVTSVAAAWKVPVVIAPQPEPKSPHPRHAARALEPPPCCGHGNKLRQNNRCQDGSCAYGPVNKNNECPPAPPRPGYCSDYQLPGEGNRCSNGLCIDGSRPDNKGECSAPPPHECRDSQLQRDGTCASGLCPDGHEPVNGNCRGAFDQTSEDQTYTAASWIGIDGTGNCDALLQAGVAGEANYKKSSNYYAWYEFYPDPPVRSSLKVSKGDLVYVNVTATSTTTGKIFFDNKTTGLNATHLVNAPAGKQLCKSYADFIMEDPGTIDAQVPFPAFGAFSMYNVTIKDASNKTYNASNPYYNELHNKKTDRKLCEASMSNLTTIDFTYKGLPPRL